MQIIAENKKAYFDYHILEKFEGGISLNGQEVKSLKTRSVSLTGSYVVLRQNELFWVGAIIPAYQPKNAPDYNPERPRKLLLKKLEINKLTGRIKDKGLTLVPLKVYTRDTKIKLEFALVKGKSKTDKRETLKKKETKREIERALKTEI